MMNIINKISNKFLKVANMYATELVNRKIPIPYLIENTGLSVITPINEYVEILRGYTNFSNLPYAPFSWDGDKIRFKVKQPCYLVSNTSFEIINDNNRDALFYAKLQVNDQDINDLDNIVRMTIKAGDINVCNLPLQLRLNTNDVVSVKIYCKIDNVSLSRIKMSLLFMQGYSQQNDEILI